MSAERGFGHTPHDQITDLALSPSFATDQTVFAISGYRPFRSTDGGAHWEEMVKGLTGEPPSRFAISPIDHRVVYLSSLGGGVYRSNDQGVTWESTNTGPADVVEIDVSPSSSDVVVAAAAYGGGLYRTLDGGDTWTKVPGIGKTRTVTFVPDRVGRVVVGGADGSLYLSDDDGATFRPAGEVEEGAEVTAAVVGMGEAGSTLFAGTSGGEVLRSHDQGDSWSRVGPGIPDQQVTSLAMSDDYATDHTVWASTWDDGVYRSTDGGETWTGQFDGLTTDPQADEVGVPQFRALAVAPGSGNQLLFLGGYDGAFKSSDGGSHWSAIETQSEYVTGLAVSPSYADDGTVIVNTYVKGVYISRDRGRSFAGSHDGLEQPIEEGNELLPVRRMHNVVFSPGYAADGTIFTATWDHFVTSIDRGRTWTNIVVAPPPPDTALRQFVIGVSPSFPADQTIYLGTRQGDVYRSTAGGAEESWTTVANLGSRVRSMVLSPDFDTDRTLFASTEEGIVTSSDAGATWTRTGPAGISLLAISSSYASDRTLFAGTESGLYVTRDRGETWSELTAEPLSSSDKVEAIALSPDFQNDGTVLVSVAGTGLFRSTDGGRTFTVVAPSLLERGLVIADFSNPTSAPIQFSPAFAIDRTVYAYAQQSVVRSTDAGDTWDVLDIPPATEYGAPPKDPRRGAAEGNDGLPVVPMAVVGGLLVAGVAFVVRRQRASRTPSKADAVEREAALAQRDQGMESLGDQEGAGPHPRSRTGS